jgi:hypothetical protein
MKTTIELAREAGFAIDVSKDPNSPPSWWGAGHDDKFKAFEALIRADEREQGQKWFDAVTAQHKQLILAERKSFIAEMQAQIDHAVINELRLTPNFGKQKGDLAVGVGSIEAALDAIRNRKNT